jgi:hypothetical protein
MPEVDIDVTKWAQQDPRQVSLFAFQVTVIISEALVYDTLN